MSKSDALSTVYCAYGEDALKLQAVAARLVARLKAYGDIEMNSASFTAGASSVDDVIAACNTAPFFSNYRLVRLDGCERLRAADIKTLCGYIGNPCPTTVLYLQAEKLAANSPLAKAIKAANPKGLIDCTMVSNKELPNLVAKMAAGYGLTLEPAARAKMIDLVGANTIQLDNELKKLSLAHAGSSRITAAMVEDAVNPSAEVKPWAFLDAIAKRDLAQALAQLKRLDSEPPLGLLTLAVGRFRDLAAVKSLEARGQADRIADELKRQPWQIGNYRTWARLYSFSELGRAIAGAAECEALMKSGTDDRQALTDWLVRSIAKGRS